MELIALSQALQVSKVDTNGYLEENLGEVRLLDHFHKFLFFVNTTQLTKSYKILQENKQALKTYPNDTITKKLHAQLDYNLEDIGEILTKLGKPNRSKRGLANILGKAVKFITGNLDNDDLIIINENLDKLHANQKGIIEKINQFTSFANNINKRLSEEAEIFNKNLDNTKKYLSQFQETTDRRDLLLTEVYQSENLLNQLKVIERTISFSLYNIPNLEIINVRELMDIQGYLAKLYSSKQLLPINKTNLFQLLGATKISTIITEQTITLLLKIPILRPISANLSRIYPIPNQQNILILPPRKYLITFQEGEFWTDEDCGNVNDIKVCVQEPIQHQCTTKNISQCATAMVSNNYEIVQVLENRQLLVLSNRPTKVIEDCSGVMQEKTLQGTLIVSSPCRVIIGTSSYASTMPRFDLTRTSVPNVILNSAQKIDLQLRHLIVPQEMSHEITALEEPISLHDQLQYTGTGGTILVVIVLIALGILFRKRLHELLCKPRTILHIRSNNPENSDEGVPKLRGEELYPLDQ